MHTDIEVLTLGARAGGVRGKLANCQESSEYRHITWDPLRGRGHRLGSPLDHAPRSHRHACMRIVLGRSSVNHAMGSTSPAPHTKREKCRSLRQHSPDQDRDFQSQQREVSAEISMRFSYNVY